MLKNYRIFLFYTFVVDWYIELHFSFSISNAIHPSYLYSIDETAHK